MPSALRIRLYCCPRSRCTNRDWDESRAWWPPMRDFIRARTRRRDKHWGVRWMSVPNKNTTSKERKLLQHQRWFHRGQKWRTGSEGRISVLKRRHGLRRCLYPGLDGMRRWVGLGVIADNIIQMGCYLARQST